MAGSSIVTVTAAHSDTDAWNKTSNSTDDFSLVKREYTGLPSKWLQIQSLPWYKSRVPCRDLFSFKNDVCNPDRHIDSLDACVLFRSLEWLGYSLSFNAENIQAADRNRFFDLPYTEGGDIAVLNPRQS